MLKDDILKIMVYINFNLFADLDKSITEVAQQCGFSLATYSRKFKQVFGKSPTEWRDILYNFDQISEKSKICKVYQDYICYSDTGIPGEVKELKIVNLEAKNLNYSIFYGNFHRAEFVRAWEEFKNNKQNENNSIGIPIDAPTSTGSDKCLYLMAEEDDSEGTAEDMIIHAGRYLQVGFKGAFEQMKEVYFWLYKFYLPANNLKYDFRTQFQEFEPNVDFSREIIRGDLYLPVKRK